MNQARYAAGVAERLSALGFASAPPLADLAARLPVAMARDESWGRLVIALAELNLEAPERESLAAAVGAWVREMARRGPTYVILVFPYDRRVPDDLAASVRALRREDGSQRWGLIPWTADLDVELLDRPVGFPRVDDQVARAITEVERGTAEQVWRQTTGPRIGRRGLAGFSNPLGRMDEVPVTRLILAATVAYYLWSVMQATGGLAVLNGPSSRALIKWGANYSPSIMAGEQWRLLTYILLHGGLLHLGFNMWALWSLGRHVEMVYGSWRMSFIYLVAGVAGGIASSVLRGGVVLSVGASGAIMGLMGALVYFGVSLKGRQVDWRALLTPVVINLFYGFLIPFIDNWCHIGGLIGGFAAAFLVGSPGQRTAWRMAAVGVVGVALLLVLAGVLPV